MTWWIFFFLEPGAVTSLHLEISMRDYYIPVPTLLLNEFAKQKCLVTVFYEYGSYLTWYPGHHPALSFLKRMISWLTSVHYRQWCSLMRFQLHTRTVCPEYAAQICCSVWILASVCSRGRHCSVPGLSLNVMHHSPEFYNAPSSNSTF
jgi:hypothetical protein